MNIYELELRAKCPNGTLDDRYDCIIRSEGIIHVERINELAQRVRNQKLFQEDIADNLRNELQARIVLIGWHFGVKVTCVRE